LYPKSVSQPRRQLPKV